MKHMLAFSLLAAARSFASLDARAADAPQESTTLESGALAHASEPPTALTAGLSAGAGGGTVGIAGRLGLELDYWPSEHLGVGAVASISGQTSTELLGSQRMGYWLVGPALVARTHGSGTHALFSGALGYMQGHVTDVGDAGFFCIQGDCEDEEPTRTPMHGLGASFGAGLASGDGPVQLGLLASLDVLAPAANAELDATLLTFTLNLTLTLGI